MGNVSKNQLYLIIGAFSLIVLLYFAPKKARVDTKKVSAGVADKAETLTTTVVQLPAGEQKKLDALNTELAGAANNAAKEKGLTAVIDFWKLQKQPLQAAFASRKLAEIKNTAADWIIAGDWFYKTTKFVADEQRPEVYQDAVGCYEKALELEPVNSKAKVKLGVCYVEGTSDPMKGVGLLKDVADKDPKNMDAQLNLGFFSVTSKQYDKALERFNNLLKIDSAFVDAYAYLANTYEMMGDKRNAIINYKKYQTLVKDTMIRNELGKYIDKLKTN